MAAEIRSTVMLAHHNAPLSLSDHLGPMNKQNFPDSKISKLYQCARTKTACILNYAIAPYLQSDLIAEMKQQTFFEC